MKDYLPSVIVFILAIATACGPWIAKTPSQAKIGAVPNGSSAQHLSAPAPADAIAIKEECISLEQQLPSNLVLSDVWVINQGAPYLENLDEHTVYAVPLRGGGLLAPQDGDMAISPDGTHLAYIDKYYDAANNHRTQKRILRVIRSSGHSLDMSYWVENWQWLIGWVNNQEIAILTAKRDVVILNPITGNWRKFQQPGWMQPIENTYWRTSPYNPTLEWILDYPDYKSVALKNVRTGQTVWQTNEATTTAWSTNNATLAVVSKKSITIIKAGKQEAAFDINQLGYDYVSNAKLSSDGRKLAFNSSKNYNSQLTFLDIAQRKLGRLCADGFRIGWDGPIWSPDNRFVVQGIYDATHYKQFDVLIDTQQMRAYLLNSGYYQHRIVWLAKP